MPLLNRFADAMLPVMLKHKRSRALTQYLRVPKRKAHIYIHGYETGWPNEQNIYLPFWKIGESEPRSFKPRSSQTNDFKIDTCRFLARHLALLGQGKDWLIQCQDNVP